MGAAAALHIGQGQHNNHLLSLSTSCFPFLSCSLPTSLFPLLTLILSLSSHPLSLIPPQEHFSRLLSHLAEQSGTASAPLPAARSFLDVWISISSPATFLCQPFLRSEHFHRRIFFSLTRRPATDCPAYCVYTAEQSKADRTGVGQGRAEHESSAPPCLWPSGISMPVAAPAGHRTCRQFHVAKLWVQSPMYSRRVSPRCSGRRQRWATLEVLHRTRMGCRTCPGPRNDGAQLPRVSRLPRPTLLIPIGCQGIGRFPLRRRRGHAPRGRTTCHSMWPTRSLRRPCIFPDRPLSSPEQGAHGVVGLVASL